MQIRICGLIFLQVSYRFRQSSYFVTDMPLFTVFTIGDTERLNFLNNVGVVARISSEEGDVEFAPKVDLFIIYYIFLCFSNFLGRYLIYDTIHSFLVLCTLKCLLKIKNGHYCNAYRKITSIFYTCIQFPQF